jgi:hypothetical protein
MPMATAAGYSAHNPGVSDSSPIDTATVLQPTMSGTRTPTRSTQRPAVSASTAGSSENSA